MNRLVLLATVLLMAGMAQADATEDEFCANVGETAESVMTSYQIGVPMSQLMALAGDDALLRQMIEMAYDSNSYSSEGAKAKQLQDYRNFWESACYDSFR